MFRIEHGGEAVAKAHRPSLESSPPRATRIPSPAPRLDAMRVLDVIVASAALVVFAPVMLFIYCAVRLHDGESAFFAHERIGFGGRKFRCLKFRSMVPDAQARLAELLARDPQAREEWRRDHKLKSDPRITPLGRFLRESSLDELPQIFNVLRGDMSIVGPRPIVDAEVVKYGRSFRHNQAVRPGITGLWQVSGRNDTEYSVRVALDVLYRRRRSVLLNLWIVVMTLPAVLLKRGSY